MALDMSFESFGIGFFGFILLENWFKLVFTLFCNVLDWVHRIY